MEYIIIADYKGFGKCMVIPCGTKSAAEIILERMQTNPTENDKRLIGDGTNLRIEAIELKDAWWNDPVLVR